MVKKRKKWNGLQTTHGINIKSSIWLELGGSISIMYALENRFIYTLNPWAWDGTGLGVLSSTRHHNRISREIYCMSIRHVTIVMSSIYTFSHITLIIYCNIYVKTGKNVKNLHDKTTTTKKTIRKTNITYPYNIIHLLSHPETNP